MTKVIKPKNVVKPKKVIKAIRPKNITVQVACLPDEGKVIEQLFFDCLADYSKRFNAPISKEKFEVFICLIEYEESTSSQGLTSHEMPDGKRILIQLRDPLLNDWELNQYTMDKFINILCHEVVHACQHICNRKGITVRSLQVNKNDEREKYFFDPIEMEARLLEAPYSSFYGSLL